LPKWKLINEKSAAEMEEGLMTKYCGIDENILLKQKRDW